MNNDRLAIGFSCVGHTYAHLVMLLYPTVVLALEAEWGLSYGELLSLSIAGFVLFGAGALPAGWFGDRWSAERMMVIFFVGTGGACIATGLATGPLGVALGLALIGLFASIYHPVGIAWLVRASVNRGRVLGVNGIFGSAGMAAAPFVAGALTDLISWRAAFIVPGVFCALTGLVLSRYMRSGQVVARTEDRIPEPATERHAMVRVFVILSVTMMAAGLVYQATSVALPKVFADDMRGLTHGDALHVGTFVTLVYAVSATSHLVGGWLADRFSPKLVYVLGWVIQVPLLMLAGVTQDWPLLVVVMAMVYLNTGVTPAENLLLVRYTPGKWRATAFGAKFVLALGVSALGVPVVALIRDGTGGFYWLFAALAGLGAIVALAAMLLPNRRRMAVAAPAVAAAE